MRCRDVSRAIAAPSGAIPPAELEAHLAACPRCAREVADALRLDRLWEATRPAPPPPAAWDACWARIDRELAAPEPLGSASPAVAARPSRRPIRLVVGLALAAAAAALVAIPNLPEPAPTTARSAPIRHDFDVEVGHTVLFHVDTGGRQVIRVSAPPSDGDLTYFDGPEADVDVDYFALLNWFEAMPEVIASALDGSSPFGPLP